MKAVIYGRFSTGRQSDGDSERRQAEATRRFCERNGWEVAEQLLDAGLSGFHGANNKAKLGAFLERVASGKVGRGTALVFENWDRFSRQPFSEVYPRITALLRKGVTLASVSPEVILTAANADDIDKIMMFMVPICLGHQESKKKSERVSANWDTFRREQISKGIKGHLPGMAPGWLTWAGKEYVADKSKAATVKQLVAWALDGIPIKQMMKRLNVKKVPVLRTVKDASGQWSVPTISRILRNPALIGLWQPKQRTEDGKERVEVGKPIKLYPAIVRKDQFFRVQAILKKNTGRKAGAGEKVTNLFSGLMTCRDDGSPALVVRGGTKANGKSSPTLYSRDTWRGISHVPSFPYNAFETTFLRWFRELRPSDLKGTDQANEENDLEAQLAECDARVAAVQKRRNQFPDYEVFLEELGEQQRQRMAIAKQLDDIRSKSLLGRIDHKDTMTLLDMHDKANHAQRPELRQRIKGRIAQLVKGITFRVWLWSPGNEFLFPSHNAPKKRKIGHFTITL